MSAPDTQRTARPVGRRRLRTAAVALLATAVLAPAALAATGGAWTDDAVFGARVTSGTWPPGAPPAGETCYLYTTSHEAVGPCAIDRLEVKKVKGADGARAAELRVKLAHRQEVVDHDVYAVVRLDLRELFAGDPRTAGWVWQTSDVTSDLFTAPGALTSCDLPVLALRTPTHPTSGTHHLTVLEAGGGSCPA